MDLRRLAIEIDGAVQGVGFRPFVYRLATDLALTGWVLNDARGVAIDVEGEDLPLRQFLHRLPAERPPQAVIHALRAEWRPPVGYSAFEIRGSAGSEAKSAAMLPDLAVCPECLAEVFDPNDRRARYAFANCTRCGPRFSIIEALPYDRPNTTMRRFAMCPQCAREYDDPTDRRFHAQPNACPVCGPRLRLWVIGDGGGRETAVAEAALSDAARALREGEIVAVKGIGGFHLMVDAADDAGVERLRAAKRRPRKPFALMARDLDDVLAICEVSAEAAALLASAAAPIVLLPRRAGAAIADAVAPGAPTLGVMLPATPLHHLLLREVGRPLVATSGNVADEPICIDEVEAAQRLSDIARVFLVHDRPIVRPIDDSVADIVDGAPRLLRRARGYAPLPITLPSEIPLILAVGAHLKSTVALGVGRQAFVSQHLGDLDTPEAVHAFERATEDLLSIYGAAPAAIAFDKHPDLHSSRWARANAAERFGAQAIAVQHHHAHLAACLAENRVDGETLGVIWDGVGFGLDGGAWGGEFLLGDAAAVRRIAYLRPFALPGGDAAAREPRRSALALLWETFGPVAVEMNDIPAIAAFGRSERQVLAQMLDARLNAPATSSIGRLFDGAAALAGLAQRASFEGEAAMALEYACDPGFPVAYPIALLEGDDGAIVLDWAPMIEAIVTDVRRGAPAGAIAAGFHNGLIEALETVALWVGCPRVALSGGCFQNRILSERVAERLRSQGFIALTHRSVPANDGGISLGQIAVAAAQLAR